ncbi:cytochrome P450 20A1-like isoform X2 [Dendronephthya gigantea]|uniref:cytochrome P450 20A1-like isoform X2 n=1 Tax=Dendronephthya gigantea TaxID=151771 RepID=UPI00106D871B|nr:cytochrome P450 20A1-like isoform X2 [Dendronephthya gigantea]
MLPSHFSASNYGIFACVVIFALLYFLVYFNTKTRNSNLPGICSKHPDKGNLEDMQDAGSLHEFLTNLHKEYGPLASFWWGKQLVVSLASPKLFDEIKVLFDRPKYLFEAYVDFTGPRSIQFMNGAEGRKRRHLMDEGFSHTAVAYYYDDFVRVATDVSEKWASQPSEQHIPLVQDMIALSMKAIVLSALGDGMRDEQQLLKMSEAYSICWREEEEALKGNLPEEGDGRMEKFAENREYLRRIIKDVIRKRRDQKDKKDQIFLDSLMDADFIDEEELVTQTMTFWVGGFHTTGNTLAWCLYFLATHEEVQEKLYQEFVDVLGEETITAQILPQLKFCRQVTDETMRCSVLAPWAARYADYDIQIGEHVIPKQTPMIIALGVVLKDEDVWPDPDKFDPERFNAEETKKRHPMAFQPFGFAGKRKCPGYRFSYAEVAVVLSVLLRRFKIHLVEGQVVEPEHMLVTKPKAEIWITVTKR